MRGPLPLLPDFQIPQIRFPKLRIFILARNVKLRIGKIEKEVSNRMIVKRNFINPLEPGHGKNAYNGPADSEGILQILGKVDLT